MDNFIDNLRLNPETVADYKWRWEQAEARIRYLEDYIETQAARIEGYRRQLEELQIILEK